MIAVFDRIAASRSGAPATGSAASRSASCRRWVRCTRRILRWWSEAGGTIPHARQHLRQSDTVQRPSIWMYPRTLERDLELLEAAGVDFGTASQRRRDVRRWFSLSCR